MNLKPKTYELILNTFPRGIIITDTSGKVVFVNQKIKQILGYPAEHFLNKDFHTLVHRHPRNAECALYTALQSVSKIANQSDIFALGSKANVNVEYSVYPLFEDDKLKGHLIRVRRELMPELHQSQFIAALGHELKTPITIIASYSHLLKQAFENNNRDAFDRYLQVIEDRVETLTKLIQGLLDTIKLGAGKRVFHDELLDLDQEIKEIVEQMQETIDTHRLKLTGQTKAKLKIDPSRLFEIIANLITNAVKYSPKQDKVEIKLKQYQNYAQISVRDYGQGITAKEAKHLFEPFYRTKKAEEQDIKGLGMGLFLSRQIINHYQGEIWFATEKGEGTTFYVNLPIKRSEQ